MRRCAADHCTECDQRIVLLRGRECLERERNLERAGHAHYFDLAGLDAMAHQGIERTVQQTLADETVETCQHDAEARTARNELPFDGLHVLHVVDFQMILLKASLHRISHFRKASLHRISHFRKASLHRISHFRKASLHKNSHINYS